MCITYAWQYSCGCLAPKPSPSSKKAIHRCTSWHYNHTCTPTPLYSYLSIPCSPDCDGLSDEGYAREEDESHLFYGKLDGMTSAEDRYFGRSRSPEGCREGRPPMRKLRGGRVFLPVHADFGVVREGVGERDGEKKEGWVKVAVEGDQEDPAFQSGSKVWSRRKKRVTIGGGGRV